MLRLQALTPKTSEFIIILKAQFLKVLLKVSCLDLSMQSYDELNIFNVDELLSHGAI